MASKFDVPDSLNEEYYQINEDILGSFSKYRPPLDIFIFKEDVARVVGFYKVGGRLTNEQIEELQELVREGLVFVSRKDHPVYVKHISYQLDLVLIDKHLMEKEIADIFIQALTMRSKDFFDQPVKPVFEKFYTDIMVLTEYLWKDPLRIKALIRRLHREHTLENHAVNSGVVGLAIYCYFKGEQIKSNELKRNVFDRVATGFFIHDVGMTRIPAFIRDKDKPLTGDERQKILLHPKHGVDIIDKLDVKYKEVEACVFEHHERTDSKGYPMKKSGGDISLVGKICQVADSFSAMVTKRPYAEPMDLNAAATKLARDNQYDPEVTKTLQAILLTMKNLK